MNRGKTLKNVEIGLLANIYFDGKVQSRTVYDEKGTRKTVGVFLPGEYTFGTDQPEVMHITNGTAEILLPGETKWRTVTAGEDFDVPGNSSYQFKCATPCEYLCDYL
ncbi:MAG TPA: hypothetical protein DIC53_03965 [Synergistaceae bacterium]|jgi:hypothetical protein|nr:hypothetical protein [Synergistaceae bacterium]